jgi:hypothetical protein
MSALSGYVSGFDIPVQYAPFVPLSAMYPYDIKTTLEGKLFQYNEGYSFVHHPIFTNIKDVKAGKDTLFQMTTTRSLADILTDEQYINSTELIVFTGLKASNGLYITNIGNSLFATATSVEANEFFRIEKNTDNTFSIYQGALVFTVDRNNPWNITLQPQLINDLYTTQKFKITDSGNGVTFQTSYEAPWWGTRNIPPQYIERFISFSPVNSQVRAIGMVKDDDYGTNHNYVFESTSNIGTFTIGYDGILKWVRYYNELADKSNNNSVEIKEVINNILHNYLVDTPYKTKLTADIVEDLLKVGTMKVNLMNLKNVMTPEYEYSLKVT